MKRSKRSDSVYKLGHFLKKQRRIVELLRTTSMESLIFFLSGILLSTWCLCVINNLKKFVLEVRRFSRGYGVYCRVPV